MMPQNRVVATKVGADGGDVLAMDGAAAEVKRVVVAVAVGEEGRGVVGDDGEGDDDGGAGDPPELGEGPRHRQDAGPDQERDDVRRRRPHRAALLRPPPRLLPRR
ncbi:Os06g0228825 [Oryza sativa Japonica Group]|uniref:Os06g0228825 protein n=1 Tax=Oryza sativa subsp. japonica TaxID=39947 RepID=A0A0P0WUL4_ORYSJ|nr:hypothetical protein EE612_032858 [Oryza sativa]BAS96890.1 Os06g0228825 [Oryza sativa Japonica Group]